MIFQRRPEECVEVMNVQVTLLGSFGLGLALEAIDVAIDATATIGRGGFQIPLLVFRPRQDQLSVEVDDFVVQPLAGSEASDVIFCNLLSAGLGYYATFGENCIDICLVIKWEA